MAFDKPMTVGALRQCLESFPADEHVAVMTEAGLFRVVCLERLSLVELER
jgi:hypothetical protein